jgi:plastocyanin
MPYVKIKQGEYVRWEWTAPWGSNSKYKVEQVENPSSMVASGFNSGSATSYGSYTRQFTNIGTFYYWSGFVDTNQNIFMRGKVIVESGEDKELAINVTLGGIQGIL